MPKNVPTAIDSASIPIITPPTLALLATTAPVVNTAATEATTIIIKIFTHSFKQKCNSFYSLLSLLPILAIPSIPPLAWGDFSGGN